GSCELSFYPIDVELMFSTEPFNTFSDAAASASSLLLIEPRQQLDVEIDDSSAISTEDGLTKTIVPIPAELAATQMMLRIREVPSSTATGSAVASIAPPVDLIRPCFNSSLHIEIMTQCGLLQALHEGQPVRSCYVKVYAKVSSGSSGSGKTRTKTEFYKDGYTDLLGKFDYVGINGESSVNYCFFFDMEMYSI
ncbi:hypothetical protein BBJ28_00003146, partial [Nothophytophthora sp. Chile5]